MVLRSSARVPFKSGVAATGLHGDIKETELGTVALGPLQLQVGTLLTLVERAFGRTLQGSLVEADGVLRVVASQSGHGGRTWSAQTDIAACRRPPGQRLARPGGGPPHRTGAARGRRVRCRRRQFPASGGRSGELSAVPAGRPAAPSRRGGGALPRGSLAQPRLRGRVPQPRTRLPRAAPHPHRHRAPGVGRGAQRGHADVAEGGRPRPDPRPRPYPTGQSRPRTGRASGRRRPETGRTP